MGFASPKTSEAGIALVAPTEADYGGSSFWFGSDFTATAGATTTHDVRIDKTCLLFSGSFCAEGAATGDLISFSVVDVDGIAAPAGTVLSEYVDELRVVDGERRKLQSGQTAELLGGIYLRVTYASSGASDVRVLLDWQVFV